MNKKEIKNIAASTIKFYLPTDIPWEIEERAIVKNNGCEIDVISIGYNGISALLHVDEIYQRYHECQDMDLVLRSAAEQLICDLDTMKSNCLDRIFDFDNAKNNIVSFVLNTELNHQRLSEAPHREIEDLSIAYYVLIEDSSFGMTTTMVSNHLMHQWGVDEEELYELSMANNNILLPPEIRSLNDIAIEMAQDAGILMPPLCAPSMIVVTNKPKTRGAIYMFDVDVLSIVAEQLNTSKLYILPSSIHEVIVIDAEMIDGEDINAMIGDVNQEVLSEQEILSDHAYVFDLKTKTISSI